MESELRILRRTDCLRLAERQRVAHLRHHRRGSARPQLLLDPAAPDGAARAARRRHPQRPHLEPLRPPPALPHRRGRHRRHRHVPAAQRRQLRLHHLRRHPHGTRRPHAPRHQHQHGHAAIQDACRRHGQRAPEGQGILHPELPVQRRLHRRLRAPIPAGLDRHQGHCSRGRSASVCHLVLLHRRRRTHTLRRLLHGQDQGVAPAALQ